MRRDPLQQQRALRQRLPDERDVELLQVAQTAVTVNDPRIAMPPIASGRLAAARLPKITSSTISSAGSEKPSARPMSEVTSLLIAS